MVSFCLMYIYILLRKKHPNYYTQMSQMHQRRGQKHSKKKEKKGKIHRYKSFKSLVLLNITYSIGNIYFGYALIYLSTIDFSTIMQIYSITLQRQLAQGLLVGCIPLGAILGALSAKSIMKRTSRRRCLLIANGMAFCFILLLYIRNFIVLMVMRLGQGVALGIMSTIVPILIKQITPMQAIAKFGALTQFWLSFGVFFTILLKFILSSATGDQSGAQVWIYIFGYPLIIITLQSLLLIMVYHFQTPKYYIKTKNFDQAKKVISMIYKPQFVDQVFEQKLKDSHVSRVNNSYDITIVSLGNNQILTHQGQMPRRKKRQSPNIAIFTSYHLGVLQQFAGINAVVVYGIQTTAKVYPDLKQIFTILVNFQTAVFCLFLPLLTRRFGRKSILQFGCVINSVGAGIIALGFSLLSRNTQAASGLVLAGMVIFMANYSVTIGAISFILISQIVQPRYVSYSVALVWLSAFIVMFLFPIITGKLLSDNPAALFYFFALWSLMSLIVNHKYVIETKDKPQDQINQEYKKMTCC